MIFILQSILWSLIPWTFEGISKLSITVCYLSLFAIAFAVVAVVEMIWEDITGRELPE